MYLHSLENIKKYKDKIQLYAESKKATLDNTQIVLYLIAAASFLKMQCIYCAWILYTI